MNKKTHSLAQHLLLVIVSIFMLYPFYFLIISVTNASSDIISGRHLPGGMFFTNLQNTFSNPNIINGFVNSLWTSILITIVSTIISFMAGYAFQFFGNKVTERIYAFLLLSMMIPFAALMVPLFKLVVSFGLSNSFPAVILPSLVSVFSIFFIRQSLKKFPYEVVESARIDGANEMMIFIKIVSPMMVPVYATVAILTFMNAWTNYLWPLIILGSPQKYTLPLVLASLSSKSNYYPDYGVIMMVTLLSAIPPGILFFSLQKYYVNGLGGAIK